MESALAQIIQERMSTAHTEQIWAVTIVGSMSGLVIARSKELVESIGYNTLRLGIWLMAGLCVAFILLRHGIYWYYSGIIDNEMPFIHSLSIVARFSRLVVLLSGVCLYSGIVTGMAFAALRVCKSEELKRQKKSLLQNENFRS